MWKFQNRVPNQVPGTEPGSSGLNFLGEPRSYWLYQEVTGFSQELTGFCHEQSLQNGQYLRKKSVYGPTWKKSSKNGLYFPKKKSVFWLRGPHDLRVRNSFLDEGESFPPQKSAFLG